MRLSIRTLLAIPFFVLTLTPIGIVGWLFYSNSQKAVEQIAEELFNQISDRTQEQIQTYLATPHFINRINANAIQLGLLDLQDRDDTERYFVEQFRAAYQGNQTPSLRQDNTGFSYSINNVYIGTVDGTFSGAEYRSLNRTDPGSEAIIAISRSQGNRMVQYRATQDGRAGDRLDPNQESSKPFRVLQRPWYLKGKELWDAKQEAGWSVPYCDNSTERPAITAVRPVANPQKLLGILGSDFLFSDIDAFLKHLLKDLKVSGGEIFILNQNREVLIDSSQPDGKSCDPQSNQGLQLTLASSIQQSIISQIVNVASTNKRLNRVAFQGQNYFWNSLDIQDNYGLKLSIFIVIPEASFTGEIETSTRYTIFLCLVILVITGVLGLIISNWITQPILRLERGVKGLADSLHKEELATVRIENPSELHTLAQAFDSMTTQLSDLFIAFSHFVPQNFLTTLGCKDPTEVQLGDYRKTKMTILFSDIRSFTSLSETMNPEENFKFINSYLARMEPAVIEHHGFIDKYIGDAIMALFEGDDSSDNAVKASLSMLRRLDDYNQHRATQNYSAIKVGIGIHTGEITLGTLGGLHRWDTTVIGGDVNRASRVEGLTKEFGASLLVSQQTLNDLKNTYCHRYLGATDVKGLQEPVKIYEIYEADAPELCNGKTSTAMQFQTALHLYEQRHYIQALELFEDILKVCPEDGAAKFYIQTCKNHLI